MSEIKVKYPIVVSYSVGATINVGNYETMRVNVGLSLPVYDPKQVDKAYEMIIKKVEALLKKKVAEYSQSRNDEEPILLEEL